MSEQLRRHDDEERASGGAVVLHQADVELTRWDDPVRGSVGFRTLLGGDGSSGTFTAGVTEMRPGDWLGHHRHEPAELYHVLEGEGVVVLDGIERAVRAGSVVFIPSDVEHAVRNNGTGNLRFFYAFAVPSFADIEYRFSRETSSRTD